MNTRRHTPVRHRLVLLGIVLLFLSVAVDRPARAQGLDDAVRGATVGTPAGAGSTGTAATIASEPPAIPGGASTGVGSAGGGSSIFDILDRWLNGLPSFLRDFLRSLLPKPPAIPGSGDGSGGSGSAASGGANATPPLPKTPGAGLASGSGTAPGGGSPNGGSNIVASGSGATPGVVAPGAGGSLNLPARPADALSGSAFLARLRTLPASQHERAILDEIARGNVPDFMRQFCEVRVSARGRDGREHTGTVRVLPDYLSIGTNDDFVRMPMTPQTAQAIADRAGCILPTRQIVNTVAAQAQVRLQPQPIGSDRGAVATIERHQRMVETQRAGQPLGALTVGAKKDVVVSNLIPQRANHVVIYGWHSPNGQHIQPLSNIHAASYVDYSHGIRLVSGTMTVDGQQMAVADVLRDPDLCRLVSDEGVVRTSRYATR